MRPYFWFELNKDNSKAIQIGRDLKLRKLRGFNGWAIKKHVILDNPVCRKCKWSGTIADLKVVRKPYIRGRQYAGFDLLCPKCGNEDLSKFSFKKKKYFNYKK